MTHSDKTSRLWGRVGFWVGVVVFMVPAIAVMARIQRWFGINAVGLVTFAAVAGAWLCHSERSRILVEEFFAALTDEGISDKDAAHEMGVTQSVLSEWRSGTKQLSLSRAASLRDGFWVTFCRRVITRWGGGRVEVLDGAVADLVRLLQPLPELLRAEIGQKRMAKAELSYRESDEGVA
jgi:transcriptional regulator with XRE-family HTH domain